MTDRQPCCYGYCGDLGWTLEKHGRVTHKQACPHRTEPWCQSHPDGCPESCEPPIWRERRLAEETRARMEKLADLAAACSELAAAHSRRAASCSVATRNERDAIALVRDQLRRWDEANG